jgi:Zn-dependent protease
MLLLQGYSLADILALLTALVLGFTVHEYAHARVAFALGDLTAYLQGRLTLNPVSHIDPFGALMFLLVGFGWARPVPIDPYRLGRRGTLLVAIAGPLSNVAMAFVAGLPIRLGLLDPGNPLAAFLAYFALFQIFLAVFNMLPIAPLDGWKVLLGLVPPQTAAQLSRYESYGPMILLAVLLLGAVGGASVLQTVMGPFVRFLSWLVFWPVSPFG